MATKHYQPGELLLCGKHTYKAASPIKKGDCLGCDFKHYNGEHNECHAPTDAGCKDCIFKKYNEPIDPETIDLSGCRTGVIVIASVIGALMAALSTAIYYSII